MDLITPIPISQFGSNSILLVLQHNTDTLCAQRGGQLLGNNNVTLHILSAPPIYPPSSCLVYYTLLRCKKVWTIIIIQVQIVFPFMFEIYVGQTKTLLQVETITLVFFLIRQSPNSGKQDQVQIVTCTLIIMYTVVVHIFPSYSILYHTFI